MTVMIQVPPQDSGCSPPSSMPVRTREDGAYTPVVPACPLPSSPALSSLRNTGDLSLTPCLGHGAGSRVARAPAHTLCLGSLLSPHLIPSPLCSPPPSSVYTQPKAAPLTPGVAGAKGTSRAGGQHSGISSGARSAGWGGDRPACCASPVWAPGPLLWAESQEQGAFGVPLTSLLCSGACLVRKATPCAATVGAAWHRRGRVPWVPTTPSADTQASLGPSSGWTHPGRRWWRAVTGKGGGEARRELRAPRAVAWGGLVRRVPSGRWGCLLLPRWPAGYPALPGTPRL